MAIDSVAHMPGLADLDALGKQAQHFSCQLVSALQQRFDGVMRGVNSQAQQIRERRKGGFQLHGELRTRPKRIFLPGGRFAAIIPGNSVAEQVITTGLGQFFSLYNTAIIVRLVLTWFPNPPQVIAGPLSTLCDPYLNLFRGIIPPLNGTIDLSPILAFIALDLLSNTTAALPAEVGPDGKLVRQPPPMAFATKSMLAWKRRVDAQRSRRQQKKQSQQQQ